MIRRDHDAILLVYVSPPRNIRGCFAERVIAVSGPSKKREDGGRKRTLEDTLARVSDSLERAKIAEYVTLMSRPRRLIWLNILAGLARGAGLAVGFTLLGAMIIYVLTRSYILNLPIIGNFLGEIVWIIQQYLKGKG